VVRRRLHSFLDSPSEGTVCGCCQPQRGAWPKLEVSGRQPGLLACRDVIRGAQTARRAAPSDRVGFNMPNVNQQSIGTSAFPGPSCFVGAFRWSVVFKAQQHAIDRTVAHFQSDIGLRRCTACSGPKIVERVAGCVPETMLPESLISRQAANRTYQQYDRRCSRDPALLFGVDALDLRVSPPPPGCSMTSALSPRPFLLAGLCFRPAQTAGPPRAAAGS